MRYRRTSVAGETYFFTVNLAQRSSRLLLDRVDDLRAAMRYVHKAHPFETIAWVVLPDHLHAVWRLPKGDSEYSVRWGLIKSNFSRCIPKGERTGDSKNKKGERGIWQRRFWEHLIRDDLDLQRHMDHIHYNPVKHGHVIRTIDWPHSSFHRYLRLGWVDVDWGYVDDFPKDFGERD